jgi:hypothetical protein
MGDPGTFGLISPAQYGWFCRGGSHILRTAASLRRVTAASSAFSAKEISSDFHFWAIGLQEQLQNVRTHRLEFAQAIARARTKITPPANWFA